MFKEIEIKSALHYHERKIATNYDLNIYRGCQHKCKYCFAQYSHKYLESEFFDDIFIKMNVPEILDKELSKKTWNKAAINISGVTDCYQPIETKYKIMPEVLKVLIKHKNPVIIITKSPLILRDYDLIEELSKVANVNVLLTITTLDEEIRKKIEPNTFPSIERFNALKELAKIKNCETSTMFMPIIPYLTDTIINLEAIFQKSKEAQVDYLISDVLNLKGNTKKNFYSFLQETFPRTYEKIQPLYENAFVSQNYRKKLNKFLLHLRQKYHLFSRHFEDNCDKNQTNQIINNKQLDLFDFL